MMLVVRMMDMPLASRSVIEISYQYTHHPMGITHQTPIWGISPLAPVYEAILTVQCAMYLRSDF
jgi:hypothetical protein